MRLSSKTLGKMALASSVAIAFLISALLAASPTEAGSPAGQDPAKIVVEKAEIQRDVRKGVQIQVQEKAVAKDAMIAVPAKVGRAAPAANLEAVTQRYIQQLTPIFQVELRLLTSACEPSPTQRREIAVEGGRALRQAATNLAEVQVGMNQAAVRKGAGVLPDPRQLIREPMLAIAKEKLTPDQFSHYQKEMEARAKEQREIVRLNLIANLDKLLLLNSEQRGKIGDFLLLNWDDRTYPTVETVAMYDGYYPTIPDQFLNTILDQDQRTIWKGATKINFGPVRNANVLNNNSANGFINDVDDEDVKAALIEAERVGK